MRIYLNGSFSSGKSTIKRWCANHYKIAAVPEIFRTILAERESTISELRSDVERITDVQQETINRQFEYESRLGDNFVACRGIDSLAFLIEFGEKKRVTNFLSSKEVENYIEWLTRPAVYTFLVKPDKALLKNDGVRDVDWDLSLTLYGSVKTLLAHFKIPYIVIESTNMADRQNLIQSTIKI
jgi:nicotinamide riboside kinase